MPPTTVNSDRLQDLRVSLTMVERCCKENDVAQQDTPQKEMPVVPKPLALERGTGLFYLGLILGFIGFFGAMDDYSDAQAAMFLLGMFGSAMASVGFLLLLLGLLIHAIRVEGTAIRAGVVLPYPKPSSNNSIRGPY